MGQPLGGPRGSNLLSMMPQGPPPAPSFPWQQLADDTHLFSPGDPTGFYPILPMSQGQAQGKALLPRNNLLAVQAWPVTRSATLGDTWDPSYVSQKPRGHKQEWGWERLQGEGMASSGGMDEKFSRKR